MGTRTELRETVESINRRFGLDWAIDYGNGKPRMTAGVREISLRMVVAQMAIWIDGALTALNETKPAPPTQEPRR